MATPNTNPDTKGEAVDTSLDNFNWDDSGTESFFGIEGEAPAKTPPAKAPAGKKAEDEEEEEEEEVKDVTFFEQASDEEEEEDDNGQPKLIADTQGYKSLAAKLKEQGFFNNVELPEEDLTEEEFYALNEQEHENRVDEALEELMTGLDPDAAAFLKFKKEGGDTKKFFEIYNKTLSAPSGDLKDESYQEKVARYYYENIEALDAEDIDDKIEWLKESGKLGKYAEKFDAKVKVVKDEELQAENQSLKDQAKNREASAKAFVTKIDKALNETTEVGNFVFDKKLKDALKPFITQATVKTGKNSYATGMQVKMQEALKDPQKLLVLAKLFYTDFDTSDILEMGKTKLTKTVKENIKRVAPTLTNSTGGREKGRSLADYNF